MHYHALVEDFTNNVKVMRGAKYSNVKKREAELLARCTFIINEIEWGGVRTVDVNE